MCPQIIENVERCTNCEKELKRVRTSDPRKGYDVLRETADGWTVQCKGCGQQFLIRKG